MVVFLVLWHVIGGTTDYFVSRTLGRAYDSESRSADALEKISDVLENLESRFVGSGKAKADNDE